MPSRRCVVPPRLLPPFLCFTVFIIQLGVSLSALHSTKLMQHIICKSHLDLPPTGALLPEEDCHSEEVQSELNLINTGVLVSATIGSALVAFPMGLFADRAGRVPILTLSILGMLLSSTYSISVLWKAEHVPLKALWGTGALLLVGGGRSVAEAIVFTIISDVVPERRRAVTLATLLVFLPGISYLLRKKDVVKRDVSFLYGSVFFLVLGSLLFMMITGPDFIIAGVVLTALASGTPTLSRALLVSFLPNTKHTGALFGILAVGEIFGFLMCQLGMGVLFDVGLSLWMGLPFGVGMVLAVTIGVLVWMVRVPRAVKDEEDDEGSDWETTSRLSSLDRYQLYLKSLAWYPRRYEITVAQALGGEAIWVGVDR